MVSRSATLEQAGGLQRMVLRGHRGPLCKLVILPDGQHLLSASTDGKVQVGAGGWG